MTNAKYDKAARQENAFRKFLTYNGWNATRSAGSHGMWDIYALPPMVAHVPEQGTGLAVQIGPHKLDALTENATYHRGVYAHCVFIRGKPVMAALATDEKKPHYIKPEEFLVKYCGMLQCDVSSFDYAVQKQTAIEREQRQLRKLKKPTGAHIVA